MHPLLIVLISYGAGIIVGTGLGWRACIALDDRRARQFRKQEAAKMEQFESALMALRDDLRALNAPEGADTHTEEEDVEA